MTITSRTSRQSLRGLDWFTFFLGDIQTGFGPFIAVYLSTQKWNQTDIGLVLSVGALASLFSQIPGGWLVDGVRSERSAAAAAVAAIGVSAFMIAVWPVFVAVAVFACLTSRRNLGAFARDCRHKPRPCRAVCACGAARAQCALCFGGKWRRRRDHGRNRSLCFRAGGFLCNGGVHAPSLGRPFSYQGQRGECGQRSRRCHG